MYKKSTRSQKRRSNRKSPKFIRKTIKNLPAIKENSEITTIDDEYENIPTELLVPTIIKQPTTFGPKETYNPQIVQNIIIEVATTLKTVEDIAKDYGLYKQILYYWMALNVQLYDAWTCAMKLRTMVGASEMEDDIQELRRICNDREEDPRWLNVKTTEFERKWKHREWFMSRINKQQFGDSKDIDINVTVNSVELRQQAWNKHRVRDAEYTEIEDTSV